ncbi:MAG: tetratricopeptide repeat protein [Polyangia bacterium]
MGAVLLGSAYTTHGSAHADETPSARDGFLVLPFVNSSPVKQLDWMASALAISTADKLEHLSNLRPVYGPRVLDVVDAVEDGKKIPVGGTGGTRNDQAVAKRAYELGAKWVVAGRFARPSWKAEVAIDLLQVLPPSKTEAAPSLRILTSTSGIAEREGLQQLLIEQIQALVNKAGWHPNPEELAGLKAPLVKDLYAFTLYGRAVNQCFGIVGPKDPQKALLVFKKLNLIAPKFAEGHRLFGECLLDAGDRNKAASQIAYALDLDPGNYDALISLVRLYRHDGNRARTLELVQKALEARPYDIEARLSYGELLWEGGDLDPAKAQLEQVLAAQPNNISARRTLALIYAAKGQTQDLQSELEKVAELSPDDIDIRLDLASAYQRTGALDKAIFAYEEVIRRQPKNAIAWKFVGDCYRRKGEPDKAVTAYQRVMKLSPEDPRPYFLLGAAYEESGQDVKAEAVFQEAQQFHRYLGEAWVNLGGIAYRRGDLSKAFWYLSRAVQRAPMRPKAHYNYALVLSAKKDRERALDELKVAADLDPEDPEIHYLSGVELLRLGRFDEAHHEFEETLKRRPDHADARHNLALLKDLEKRYSGEHAGAGVR